MKKDAIARLRADKVIGLVGADLGDALIDCARSLAAGGVNCVEIAMTTPAAVQLLEQASAALPDFCFGLGTVVDVDTARLGIIAGASFIATPSPRPEVITLCRRYRVPVISGALDRVDIAAAQSAGATAAKVFPGEQSGPEYFRSLKQLLPQAELIAIGGVNPETLGSFLRAGCMAVVAGSSLVDEATIKSADWPALTARARLFSQAAAAE